MKLWKRILLPLLVFYLLFSGARVLVKNLRRGTFYSPQRIEALLEERYHTSFTVGEQLPEDLTHAPQQDDDLPVRIWSVTADDYPDLTFQVKDGWTHSYRVRGFFGGLDSYTVPEIHTLWDDCKMVSWNAYVAPMLAETYGVTNALIPEKERYSDNLTYSQYPLRLSLENGLDEAAATVFQLALDINGAPIFRDIGAEEEHYDDPFSQYRFRIEVFLPASDQDGKEVSTWVHLYPGYPYTQEEIRQKLWEGSQKLAEELS